MARYTYNAGLVTQTIDTLYSACDCLDNTNVDIKKGIDMIWNARGAENMNIDFTPIIGYQSSVIECIETMASEIKKKAQEIEEYQDAPWYKKLFATIGMGALKIIEGLATFVENIGDGLVSIVGFIGGIFSSKFKNCVAEFVRTDYVGDTTAKWYDEGWLQSVNKYSIMSHESTAANILKGVGTAAGYVILTVATAGAGGAVAAASTGISAGAAALGGIGSGTQNALKQAQLANPEMSAGDAFNSAFAQGVKQGAIAAGTTLVTAGVAKGLQNMAGGKAFATFADNLDEASKLGKVAHGAQNLLNKGANAINATKIGGKVIGKAGQILTGAGSAADDAANAVATKVVGKGVVTKAISQGAQNIAGNGSALVNATLGTVVGSTASGQFKKNMETNEIDLIIEEVNKPSMARQMYDDAQAVLNSDEAKPSEATPDEATANLQNLKDQGYNPGGDSANADDQPTNNVDDQTTNNVDDQTTNNVDLPPTIEKPEEISIPSKTPTPSSGTTGGNYNVTAKPADLPDYTGTTGNGGSTPNYSVTDQNNIVSGITPGNPGNGSGSSYGNSGTGVSTITGNPTDIEDITSLPETDTVSSEVLDTFGDVSGSLTGFAGTKTNIPTSSSPILSSSNNGSSGSKFVPLGAGLGAASVAGIGAKSYLDKREKSKEEANDDIETEEWATQEDLEIDYGLENNSEESDYLSPTDEYAFTE